MATFSKSQSVILNIQPVDRFQNAVSEGIENATAVSSNPEFFTVTPGQSPGVFIVKGVAAGSGTITVTYQQRPDSTPIVKTADVNVTDELAVDVQLNFGEPFDTP